ncbi:MAG: hypothetical protein UW69_C0076G0003 [Microgenomates group bacterium GW2011_GWA2_44_7]|nr:MAG: hypothetical protein UW69_C0076G0003 [Microgenomates group bacterium GW2011_GWA2_44_7]HCC08672.1 hypothetical protein [Candidatus Woesebacteria bacterium]
MIKKILNKLSKILPILLILAVIPAAIKLITPFSFTFHDESQIVNLHQFIQTISLGQFPPRWALDVHFTYGSPYPEFNYQLPYYIGFLFNKIGFSLFDSYTLCLALSLFVGAYGMYLFAKKYTTPFASFASAILYTYTPYRAIDAYVRGTVGESFALAIFPWILYSLARLKEKQNLKNILILGISVASLILSHQPSTAFGLPILVGIYFMVELIQKNYKFILSLFAGLFSSLLLTSYYLIPVFAEKGYIKEVLPYNLYDHFPFIWQLIYSRWGYGASNWGPYDDMSFQIGIVNLAVILGAIIFLVIKSKKEKKVEKGYLLASLLATFFVIFMMNIRSSFIWNIFPFTNAIQFPWRLLSLTTILTATLFVFISKNMSKKTQIVTSLIVIIASFTLSVSYFRPGEITATPDDHFLRRYLPNQVLLPGEKVSKEYLDYTENYMPLPVNAVRPTDVPVAKITSALQAAQIDIIDVNPFNTKAYISSEIDSFITVNTFYFPGWNIAIDGKPVDVTLDQFGAMKVFVPAGEHTLKVKFLDTPIRRISNIISLIAWIFVAFIIIKQTNLQIRGKRR